jgi:hypothetical protein
MIHMMMDRVIRTWHMGMHKEQGRPEPVQACDQSIKYYIGTFKPFKSVGTDGILPALLQQGEEHVVPHLCCIFIAGMAYGFISTA